MTLAPLSQIVIITEDGSLVPPLVRVAIPPRNLGPPLSITGTPPTTGTVGRPYSFTPATANGAGTKVFSLAGGALLAGLSLSTITGAITGTPTAAGSMTGLSVRVTDNTGTAATTPTTVTVQAAPVAPTINNQPEDTQVRPADIPGFSAWVEKQDADLVAKGR